MPSVKITHLDTENAQGTNVDLFNPFTVSLKLVMFFTLSPDIITLPNVVFEGIFQILDLRTNQVVVHHAVQANYDPGWGQYLYWWIGSPTPHDWGVQWTQGGDNFGFRAAIEVSSFQVEQGLVAVDAFDVSDIRWFRLQDVAVV